MSDIKSAKAAAFRKMMAFEGAKGALRVATEKVYKASSAAAHLSHVAVCADEVIEGERASNADDLCAQAWDAHPGSDWYGTQAHSMCKVLVPYSMGHATAAEAESAAHQWAHDRFGEDCGVIA
jgi:hypothetical protein